MSGQISKGGRMKFSFKNDYSEGAHPQILQALFKDNLQQMDGYGNDIRSLQAADVIRKHIDSLTADVHFISGGTQTNLIFISAVLRPHEAAIAASNGHIFVHETGAIEATGHKVCVRENPDGKLTPELIQSVLDEHCDEHMVKPKLVFLSNASEIGTIYSKAELIAISQLCKEQNLLLYVDGARLGSALTATGNDLDMKTIASLVDAFYIGGTKNGALLGEALVIVNPQLQEDFRYLIKQRGAMLAKGRLLGTQFGELFNDNLFYDLAKHANQMAELLTAGLTRLGIKFLTDSRTNQVFPILADKLIDEIGKDYVYTPWSRISEDYSCIRLVTSWATPQAAVEEFIQSVAKLINQS